MTDLERDNALQARRNADPRYDASKRVRLRRGDTEAMGWTLNVSRGGLRAVLFDEKVTKGAEYQLFWDEQAEPRHAIVVWVRDEEDGQIVGLQFLDVDGSVPPP